MTARRVKPADWYPVHCAACIQAGHKTPATWLVSRGQGTRSYHSCDEHRDELEAHGLAGLRAAAKPKPF